MDQLHYITVCLCFFMIKEQAWLRLMLIDREYWICHDAYIQTEQMNLRVQKEQSKVLQSEILDKYETYKEAIERTYTNLEERK